MDFSRVLLLAICFYATGTWAQWDPMAAGTDQCSIGTILVMEEEQATVIDESPTRLHSTWISQECEMRAGPEYIIRKYTFFDNNTFVLMRHYYAEESCSIATHTVTARGAIRLLDDSLIVAGATDARYHLDTVHISPLNRQVAHKLGHRVNVSCGPQPRWRPYMPQLIYERAPERSWQGPRYNSLQGQSASSGVHSGILRSKTVNCLAPLGIDFEELKLLRVQMRPTDFRAGKFGADKPRVELHLGALPQEKIFKRSQHRPNSLQPVSLLRTDTIQNCPICGAISRGTANSPPLLHEVVTLPVMLSGSWISISCESHPGGLFLSRQLRVYGGDRLWYGRYDYHSDSRCNHIVYSVNAAGGYSYRYRRQRRHNATSDEQDDTQFITAELLRDKRSAELKSQHEQEEPVRKVKQRTKRDLEEVKYYQGLLNSAEPWMAESFAQILRGNQRQEETTKKPLQFAAPTGIIDLDLHVADSFLIVHDPNLIAACGEVVVEGQRARLTTWRSGCVPYAFVSPTTLRLRAKINIDWYGQYELLLGPKDKGLWDAPLLQCGPTSTKNPLLRSHLRRSVGLRYGNLFSKASSAEFDFGVITVCNILLVWFGAYISR